MNPFVIYLLPKDVPVNITVDPASDVKLHAVWFDLDKSDAEATAAFAKLLTQLREQEQMRKQAAS